MPNVSQGLSGPGIESSGASDDELLDRHFARVGSGSSRSEPRAPTRAPRSAPEAPRGRGKRAPHYVGSPTSDGGKASLTDSEIESFLAPGSSITEGLSYGSSRPAAPQRTADQIRAEARARDPEGWDSTHRRIEQMRARGGEIAANEAELQLWRFNAALQSNDDEEIFNAALKFAQASPAAFREWQVVQDSNAILEADEYGEEVDESQLPAFLLAENVRQTLDYEREQAMYEEAQAKKNGLIAMNVRAYESRLAEAGLAPDLDDEDSVERYTALKGWIAQSIGVDVGELAYADPATAAEMMMKADAQIGKLGHDLTTNAVHRQILGVEDANVSEGITTEADATNALLREQNDLLRAAQGLEPAGSPPIRAFDPSLEIEPTREEVEDPTVTVGKFRADLLEGEGTKGSGAWTVGGEPTTFEQASRDEVREEQIALEQRERALGLPKSL